MLHQRGCAQFFFIDRLNVGECMMDKVHGNADGILQAFLQRKLGRNDGGEQVAGAGGFQGNFRPVKAGEGVLPDQNHFHDIRRRIGQVCACKDDCFIGQQVVLFNGSPQFIDRLKFLFQDKFQFPVVRRQYAGIWQESVDGVMRDGFFEIETAAMKVPEYGIVYEFQVWVLQDGIGDDVDIFWQVTEPADEVIGICRDVDSADPFYQIG